MKLRIGIIPNEFKPIRIAYSGPRTPLHNRNGSFFLSAQIFPKKYEFFYPHKTSFLLGFLRIKKKN